MGVSEVPTSTDATCTEKITVARIAAPSVEDVYRVLYESLQPLATALGTAPYTERIHASGPLTHQKSFPLQSSQAVHRGVQSTRREGRSIHPPSLPLEPAQRLSLMQLTDATLPTGGFAHSAGAEAFQQLGLLADMAAVRELLTTAAYSQAQLHSPFAVAAHTIVAETHRTVDEAALQQQLTTL